MKSKDEEEGGRWMRKNGWSYYGLSYETRFITIPTSSEVRYIIVT